MSVHPSSVHHYLILARVAGGAGVYTCHAWAGIKLLTTTVPPRVTVNHINFPRSLQVIVKSDAIYVPNSFKFFPLHGSTAAKPNWSRDITPFCNNLGCNNC